MIAPIRTGQQKTQIQNHLAIFVRSKAQYRHVVLGIACIVLLTTVFPLTVPPAWTAAPVSLPTISHSVPILRHQGVASQHLPFQQSRVLCRYSNQLTAERQQFATEVAIPTYISDEDATRFEEAGYAVRSAVFGTVQDKDAAGLFEWVRKLTQLDDVEPFLRGGTFIDLGSGEGGLVLKALEQFPSLGRAVGVELCGERHRTAEARAAALPENVRSRAEFLEGDFCNVATNVQLARALREARVIFAATVMFDAVLMQRLSSMIRSHVARTGRTAVVLSFGKKLDLGSRPSAFDSGLFTGSWGLAPLYAYGLLPNTE